MKKIILSIAILSLTACSGGGGDSQPAPKSGPVIPGSELTALSAEQKARVLDLIREGSDVEEVATSKDVVKVELPRSETRSTEVIKELSEKGKEFKSTLVDAVNFGRCRGAIVPDPNDPNSDFNPQYPSYEFRLSHADNTKDCPVYFLRSLTTAPSDVGSTEDMNVLTIKRDHTIDFEVDPLKEVRYVLDIEKYTLGSTFVSVQKTPIPPKDGPLPKEFDITVDYTGEGGGTIVSKTEGRTTFEMKLSGNSVTNVKLADDPNDAKLTTVINLELTAQIEFQDGLKVIGYMTFNEIEGISTAEKYFINGVETDKVDFKNIFSMGPMISDADLVH